MRIKLLIAVILALLSADAHAQILSSEIALKPSFFAVSSVLSINNHEISLQNDLNINKSQTLYELYGAVSLDKLNIKASYLFPKTITGDGQITKNLVDAKLKDDFLPATASYSVSAARLELSLPISLINRYTFIEPLAFYQTTSQNLSIIAKDFNYAQTINNNALGFGIELTELISQYARLNAKLALTQNTSIFSLKYKHYDRLGYFGAGYDWTNINNANIKTTLHGPTIETGVRF